MHPELNRGWGKWCRVMGAKKEDGPTPPSLHWTLICEKDGGFDMDNFWASWKPLNYDIAGRWIILRKTSSDKQELTRASHGNPSLEIPAHEKPTHCYNNNRYFYSAFQGPNIPVSLSHTFPPFSHITMHPAIHRQILPRHTFTWHAIKKHAIPISLSLAHTLHFLIHTITYTLLSLLYLGITHSRSPIANTLALTILVGGGVWVYPSGMVKQWGAQRGGDRSSFTHWALSQYHNEESAGRQNQPYEDRRHTVLWGQFSDNMKVLWYKQSSPLWI